MTAARTIRDVVAGLASRGAAPAVIAGGETVTFAELAERVARGSASLAHAGVAPRESVAILAPNSPAWVAAALAVLEAGAVVTPIDAQLDDAALARVLAAGDCRTALTTAALAPRLPAGVRALLIDEPATFAAGASSAPRPPISPADPAALFLTSGTTGNPKGVPLTHGNLASNLDGLLAERLVGPGDRMLLPLPLHHVYPFTVGFLTPLASGTAIVFPSGVTGPEIVRALAEARVTAIVGVPRLYAAIVAGLDAKLRAAPLVARGAFRGALGLSRFLARRLGVRVGKTLFRSLHARLGPDVRAISSGGARLDPDLAWTLEALGWRVYTGYGLTETSPILTFNARGRRRLESAGRPIRGVELRIDSAAASDGEVQARGPGVFAGYRNDAERTARAFTADGWFKTGDLGHVDANGFLWLVGRVSEMIVRADGKNVMPEDVETEYSGHPFVAEIAVLERGGKLVAFVVPEKRAIVTTGGGLSPEACVRVAIAERSKGVPSYHRLQAFALADDALPRTRLGKLRRHLLPELYDRAAAGRARPAAAPEWSGEDRALREDPVGARALAVLAARFPDAAIGPDTSPQLDLGVDSLEWVNLTLEIEEKAGAPLAEAAVARVHTVRDLLREAIAAAAAGGASVRPRVDPLERPEEFLGSENLRWLRPLGPVERVASRALGGAIRLAFRVAFRLRVRGVENLPALGPFVLAPNHASDLDPFAVASALPARALAATYWAGATVRLFTGHATRTLSRLGRVVPIDARGGPSASLAFGAAVLARGWNLVWFPEGQRSFDGMLQAFLPGIGLLLARHPVPVIPVAISGSFEAWPRGAKRPRLAPIRVTFGAPLDPRALAPGGDPAALAEALREAVARTMSEP